MAEERSGTPVDGVARLVERLSVIDVCAVSDALDALGLAGAVSGILPMWEGARVVGRAVTVQLAEWPPPTDEPVHLGVRAIMASEPGDVIVIANAGRTGMGSWGGLLSTAAARRGVAGVVVDGACRDVDEAREMGFPAFARAPVARTARGRVFERSCGEPVSLGDVEVSTGDIVMADGSGVVVLAAGSAAAVVSRAEELVEVERRMRADLLAGVSPDQVLASRYQKLLNTDQPDTNSAPVPGTPA
jgi:regulator of RNase E activity RraA